MRIVFDKAESFRNLSTNQILQIVQGGITLRKDGGESTYSVKWLKDSKTFQVEKQEKGFWNWVKSQFSHGLFHGHWHSRSDRIATALNQRMAELDNASFATQDSKNKEHHWTSERVGKEISSGFIDRTCNREVFLYGFSQQRHYLKQSLAPILQSRTTSPSSPTTIDEYNADLGIKWGLGFEDYLDLLDEAGSGTLTKRSEAAPENSPRNHRKWAEFLQANREKLDITRHKDKSLDIGPEFFAKNLNPDDSQDSSSMTTELRDVMWDIQRNEQLPQDQRKTHAQLCEGIETATKNIRAVLAMATDPDFTTDEKKKAYGNLTEDEKFCIDKIVTKAFFRKTSKLGLEFARSQGSPVAFAWRLPFYGEKIEDALKETPWKKLGGRGKFAEAITLSEMRKLSRLEKHGAAPQALRFIEKQKL